MQDAAIKTSGSPNEPLTGLTSDPAAMQARLLDQAIADLKALRSEVPLSPTVVEDAFWEQLRAIDRATSTVMLRAMGVGEVAA